MSVSMSREYPSAPVVAVGAVVVHQGRALLVRRGRAPAEGAWVIPGGGVELGERVEDAVLREIHEECGISIVLGPLAVVVSRIDRDENGRVRFHYVIIDYFARYQSGVLAPGSDAADARWVSLGELSDYALSAESLRLFEEAARLA
ncbi:MAG: NUDIX hydrolase [Chloroflexota bacterium]|nr:NUDIX hydrolase [Chloroflexota bacterium]